MDFETQEELTRRLLMRLKNHDMGTYYHSLRVKMLAGRIGICMDLPADDMKALPQAAVLHDIGKLFIPKGLLRKPGRLNADEWKCMKCHAAFGAYYLSQYSYPPEILSAVLDHHERFDGNGYNRKESCSVIAQVITIADSFDAMSSGRQYEGAMTPDEACMELLRNSGTQFNPAILQVALRAFCSQQYRRGEC